MALTDFTSLDDIRAALGVSIDEIEDATISLPLYENNLAVELDEISLTLTADYATVKASSSPSAAETRFLRIMQVFCSYVVARQLTVSLPLFSPKEITDGKASMVRHAQSPYKDTILEVKTQYETYKTRLQDAYELISSVAAPVSSPITQILAVSPSYDPITGF